MKVLFIGVYKDGTGWGNAAQHYILALDAAGVDVVPRAIKLNNRNAEVPQRILQLEKKSSKGCTHVIQNVLPHHMEYSGDFEKNIGTLNMEVAIVKFFANINPPGASHTMHHHIGGHYSGAYWLQADQGSGNIIIMNPYPNNFISTFCQNTVEQTENGFKTFDCIGVWPQVNKGVFFNSNLVHYVDVNRSDRDRIGVAFHLYLKE